MVPKRGCGCSEHANCLPPAASVPSEQSLGLALDAAPQTPLSTRSAGQLPARHLCLLAKILKHAAGQGLIDASAPTRG